MDCRIRRLPRSAPLGGIAAAFACVPAGCALSDPGPDPSAGDDALVMSDRDRAQPSLTPEQLGEQARANTAFALDLYHGLRAEADEGENLFLSPYSISTVLAMTHAGARGETAEEIAAALRFAQGDGGLHHQAFNALERELAARPGETGDDETLELSVANALWAQDAYPVEAPFLDLLAEHYGTGIRLLDFAGAPEPSRGIINEWVSARTEQKIPELMPEGSITRYTRFVLTNAIYLEADWLHQFEAHDTSEETFTLRSGEEISAPRMHQIASLPYAAGDGYELAVMPYVGESLAMALIVPDRGRFDDVEASLDAAFVEEALAAAEPKQVDLGLPKFEFSSEFDLIPHLEALGMTAAFDPERSDFSGIDGGAEPDLHLTGVFHEAFVAVDEEGTEAAAATGAAGGATSLPRRDVTLHIDRPFLFAIVDEPTDTVLFVGRLLEPR